MKETATTICPRGYRLRCPLPPLARSNQEVRFPTWDLHPKRLTLSRFVMLTKPAVPLWVPSEGRSGPLEGRGSGHQQDSAPGRLRVAVPSSAGPRGGSSAPRVVARTRTRGTASRGRVLGILLSQCPSPCSGVTQPEIWASRFASYCLTTIPPDPWREFPSALI